MTPGQVAPHELETLPTTAPTYQRLVRQWWRWKSDEAWLAADHVLVVRTRFFSERYLRLYWADIAALLFFPAAQNRGLMLIAEIICLLAAPLLLLFANDSYFGLNRMRNQAFFTNTGLSAVTMAAVAVLLYTVWRLTRRRWNVQIMTLTGQAVVPLAVTRTRSAQFVNQLKRNIETAQPLVGTLIEPDPSTEPAESQNLVENPPAPTIFLGPAQPARRPLLALHATVFLLGIAASALSFATVGSTLYPLFIFAAVLFYLGLPLLFFLQQDPGFPFAVRSAAVLNMVMATGAGVGMIATWVLVGTPPWLPSATQHLGYLVNLLRLACCLFGIMSLWKFRLDKEDAPLPRQRETLS